jgi:hypothetical protein
MTSAPCDHIAQAALRICNAKMQSMIYTLITIWLLVNLLVFFLLIKPERSVPGFSYRLVLLAVRIRTWISRR